jgi:PQQ-dependent catabolism-associated CXXCW motif protein
MKRIPAPLTFFLLALAGAPGYAQQRPPVEEPAGYRLENYRAPVPSTLKGAKVVDTGEAIAIWSQKAGVFVDTLPRPPRPAGLPKDVVWRDTPRSDIPGSVWLPDTGYGELAESTRAYFENGLSKAAKGDKTRLLVFYCLKDCWMSWNAAKRALEGGYANVAWYPEGTDGWAGAGQPLEPRDPQPRD